jgi:hypothetical protein
MNASEAIEFTGGRAAASPLAYYFHLNKQPKTSKVLLGGSFVFKGLLTVNPYSSPTKLTSISLVILCSARRNTQYIGKPQ